MRNLRRRSIPIASALVLAAVILPSGASARQPGPLTVDASLGGCDTSGAQPVCTLNVSYGSIPGAQAYSATVIRPDGSAIEVGGVPAGGTSLSVEYNGPGTYTVRITAYGTPANAGG